MFRLTIISLLVSSHLNAQITSGSIQGKTHFHGKNLGNVQIVLSNKNNGTYYTTNSNDLGLYNLVNLIPDKNYSLLFYTKFTDTLLLENIEVILGKTHTIDITLRSSENILQPVLIKSTITNFMHNIALQLNAKQIAQIPSTGRDYTKLLGSFSQAFIKESANGAISFSGQNNRYNSVYIDGALQNDVFGLSANGMYGGQTGNVPVSIEAIEQIQIQLSPYDASFGGYTGAAINMITKSGKNQPFTSIYRYLQANKSLYNNTGLIISGPIKRNRLFYLLNIDFLREINEIKYDFNNYIGDTKNPNQLIQLVNSIKTNYNYDPGIVDNIHQVNAFKNLLKIDYMISKKNSLSFSIRTQFSDKSSSGNSTNRNLFLSNNGKLNQHQHISKSVEWKHQWSRNKVNDLLISYTQAEDQTSPMGKAFPNVSILDGDGFIFFGSNEDATESKVQQTNITVLEKLFFTHKKHFITTGIEVELNSIKNRFLQNSFGSYFYFNINDFVQNKKPGDYQINFYKPDQNNATRIELMKSSIFINDKIKIYKNIQLIGGLRITIQKLLKAPNTDHFIQSIVIPTLNQYHHLSDVEAGKLPSIPISLSPRLNGLVQFPKQHLLIDIGTGFFDGRMPLAWLGGIYNNNGLQYGHFEANPQQLNQIRLQKNTRTPWMPSHFGVLGNRGVLNLVSSLIHMPSIWRSTIHLTKQLKQKWLIQMEAMYYINTNEIGFKNINILPPTNQLIGPDIRDSYSALNNAKIPILPDSSNPFTQVILLANNKNKNGYGYRFGIQIKKETVFGGFTMNYAFGKSFANFDGSYNVLLNQWRLNEHVNGRNNIGLAISDFSPGHRLNIVFLKEWAINKKNKINFSMIYNGYSGTRFSYVYGKNSMVKDDANTTGFELIYIPTREELNNQLFLPMVANDFYYTADQQKEALELYIDNNAYLKNRRGSYAERNGNSTPFVNRIDGRISMYSNFQLNKRKYGITTMLDIFNLTNLLNRRFGKSYFVPSNRYRLIDFLGFVNPNQLIPMYQFNPINLIDRPWQAQISQNPHFSSNWTIQIGCKINFY
jgi:hypothetical protein